MSYLSPAFRFVSPENLKIGFLFEEKGDIVGYAERELTGKGISTIAKTEPLSKTFKKELPLCKGPDNKYWVLNSDGGIELKFIKI
jgi:hypothetical protein|tara:strand:+ start:1706 stop:1960 length:255 start_codon:yes stop_codon:yes gene_type:complete